MLSGRLYWFAFVSNYREVVCHPCNCRDDAVAVKERLKHSTLVECGEAVVGVSVLKATKSEVRAWAADRFAGRTVTVLD